jgi:hypothetical protein
MVSLGKSKKNFDFIKGCVIISLYDTKGEVNP